MRVINVAALLISTLALAEGSEQEPGTVTLKNGVIVKTLTEGTGAIPTPDDSVKVHYRGTFPEGGEFDSSFKRGKPTTFPLKGVISCWTEGLQHMKVGGKARLVCPPSTAYGTKGMPPKIPGDATLVFEIELLAIVKK